MSKHTVIFIGAGPEFHELLDAFRKILHPDVVVKLNSAASKLRDELEERALEHMRLKEQKHSVELYTLEPLLEEYREACKTPHFGPGPKLRLRNIIRKIIEIYGQPPRDARDDPI